jgi:anti-sigma factor RsiW
VSGTGPTPAEQHLGDRLAALVDGELKHDTRERVLAHLATCAKCKAAAAAQRRLKSVFAQCTPPSPSEGFLARLQGLPEGPGGDEDRQGRPFGGSGRFAGGLLPVMHPPGSRTDPPSQKSPLGRFGYLATPRGSTAVPPADGPPAEFRIHEVGREGDRSPWRGRRFAFAAASAVSLAAIALGGALPAGAGSDAPARAEGAGNSVTPLNAAARAGSGSVTSRRGGGSFGMSDAPDDGSTTGPPAQLMDTVAPAPALFGAGRLTANPFAAAVLTDVSGSPLIRPTATTPLFAHALGSGRNPVSPAPPPTVSWTPTAASALPARADRRLPLSARH